MVEDCCVTSFMTCGASNSIVQCTALSPSDCTLSDHHHGKDDDDDGDFVENIGC